MWCFCHLQLQREEIILVKKYAKPCLSRTVQSSILFHFSTSTLPSLGNIDSGGRGAIASQCLETGRKSFQFANRRFLYCSANMNIAKSGLLYGGVVVIFDNYDEGSGVSKLKTAFSGIEQNVYADHSFSAWREQRFRVLWKEKKSIRYFLNGTLILSKHSDKWEDVRWVFICEIFWHPNFYW